MTRARMLLEFSELVRFGSKVAAAASKPGPSPAPLPPPTFPSTVFVVVGAMAVGALLFHHFCPP